MNSLMLHLYKVNSDTTRNAVLDNINISKWCIINLSILFSILITNFLFGLYSF